MRHKIGHTKSHESVTRFERTRQDHARETAEDYAEMILDLGEGGQAVRPTDLSRSLGVTHVTILRTLDRLLRDGIVTRDTDQGILLSPVGQRMAETSRKRHRIVVSFLERLGVPKEIATVDAEGIEHHVSKTVLDKMADFIQVLPPARTRNPPRRKI